MSHGAGDVAVMRELDWIARHRWSLSFLFKLRSLVESPAKVLRRHVAEEGWLLGGAPGDDSGAHGRGRAPHGHERQQALLIDMLKHVYLAPAAAGAVSMCLLHAAAGS